MRKTRKDAAYCRCVYCCWCISSVSVPTPHHRLDGLHCSCVVILSDESSRARVSPRHRLAARAQARDTRPRPPGPPSD